MHLRNRPVLRLYSDTSRLWLRCTCDSKHRGVLQDMEVGEESVATLEGVEAELEESIQTSLHRVVCLCPADLWHHLRNSNGNCLPTFR